MIYKILCWSLIFFACFYGLGNYPLLDHNEGMYAAIARDMLKSHDFIIPHLNGLPYIEKPPLLYWLMAASISLFGENEFAVRLIPALALFATAWKSHRFLLRVSGSQTASTTAMIILTTSLPLLAIARMVLFDMLMTCFLSMALMFFYEGWELRHCEERSDAAIQLKRRRRGINPFCAADAASGLLRPSGLAMTKYAFYACLALAVMAKGFVAIILAGGTIATFLVWQRSPLKDYFKILSPAGILLFLCIIAPWHIAASLKEPGFAYFYFINEHVLRFLNMRQPHDYYTGHFWYYLVRIPGYLIPWTLFLLLFNPLSLWERVRVRVLDKPPSPGASRHPLPKGEGILHRFLCSWFLFCLIFFSASGAKANYYMIAGMPPLVILLALQLEREIAADHKFVRSLASIALILIISTLELVQFSCHDGNGIYPICRIITWPVIGCALCYVFASVGLLWRLPQRWVAPLLGANVLLLLPLLISGVGMAGDRISQKPVAEYLRASSDGHAAIYQEFEELSALAFYLDKPLVIVDSQSSDLLYGQQHLSSGQSEFISMAEWIAQTPPLPMVILNKRLSSVMTAYHNLCVLRQFERVSVIKRCDK